MVNVKIQVTLPRKLLRKLLQHIRDFDVKHFNEITCAIIFNDEGGMTAEEGEQVLRSIQPPFTGPMVRFKLKETGWPLDMRHKEDA